MAEPLEFATVRINKHGVRRSYLLGCRCDDCKQVGTAYQRAALADRRTHTEDAPHGTRGGYTNWGCRCEPCKTANAAYMQTRREERP
jgi:hypothetical protein